MKKKIGCNQNVTSIVYDEPNLIWKLGGCAVDVAWICTQGIE